ncbi:tetratricopeptide repeat protein [Marinifilum caeruleilacunae]|uniref:Tetratricopeptide repeat protein n=1 Tax=Marinifilum caeruleilacunae TaxID=2499076 RepID=A0ABX1WYW2_9BACT|nr:tetratricopeptide repeat protein [Marinifilum caeruleilacunae]NOU61088.1 tetratricopeptide repeat protein [Marinifilum caeruleilacunae]
MKYFALLVLIVSISIGTNAGILLNDTPKNQAEAQIDELLKKAKLLRDSSYDASAEVGRRAIELAGKTEKADVIAFAHKSQGITFFYQGLFDSSYQHYIKAREEFESINDSLNVAILDSNIGIVYRRTNQYDKALQQYLKALDIYEELENQKGIAGAYTNIGGLYQTLNDIDKALKFYIKAKNIYAKIGETQRYSRVLTNIGVIKFEKELYNESLEYQLEALRLNKMDGMLQHKAIIQLNIGECYQALEKPLKALEYFNKCEDIRLQLNDIWGLGKLYIKKAIVLQKLEQYKNAEAYFQKAEIFCQEQGLSEDLATTYHHYSKLLESIDKPKESIAYFKKFYILKDSLNAIINENLLAEVTAKFETEQKKKEFELLQQRTQIQNLELGQKNAWIIVLVVVMILGIVAVMVSLRINRLRADHKIMDLRQKVLLTQMNPHFLFNSLTAIQSFILDEKNDDANNYLSRLASLVRGILENSREEFVSLRTELRTLEDYIGLQKLRFENDIAYQFEVDASLDQDEIMVPPMLAQPFVENALIHGKLRSNPNACINIKVTKTEDEKSIKFSIIDNGIGIDKAKSQPNQKQHKSLATSIALDRVKIYNFKSSKKMNFEIIDLFKLDQKLKGTKVSYSIPIIT